MMETKEALEAQLADARRKLGKILDAEQRKKNSALVGKCFKYPKNCYSCPSKPSDYWPVFVKVMRLGQYGTLRTMEFQTDKNGRLEIRFDDHGTLSGHVPISESEFQRAWKRVQKRVASVRP